MSLDGVEWSDMVRCDEKRAGGLWLQGPGSRWQIGVRRLWEEYEQ